MIYKLRDFQIDDKKAINDIALSAFKQYERQYSDWPSFSNKIAKMSALAEHAELIVATLDDKTVGAVAYVSAGIQKNSSQLNGP